MRKSIGSNPIESTAPLEYDRNAHPKQGKSLVLGRDIWLCSLGPMAEAEDLKSLRYQFESDREYVEEEYSFWEEYWQEEEALSRYERETEKELSRQSRQIQYEADYRNGFPLGKYSKVI